MQFECMIIDCSIYMRYPNPDRVSGSNPAGHLAPMHLRTLWRYTNAVIIYYYY